MFVDGLRIARAPRSVAYGKQMTRNRFPHDHARQPIDEVASASLKRLRHLASVLRCDGLETDMGLVCFARQCR
jgi:hypothetical protein